MLDHEYDTMRTVEDHHWWYDALRAYVVREVKRLVGRQASAHILDAGCGTGGTLDALRTANSHGHWQLDGIDISPLAVEHTHARGFTEVVLASLDAMPFASASMDAVVSLDVLYHEQIDEAKSLAEIARVLRPGGYAVINLPAFDSLRGSHDDAVSGVRRYTAARLRVMLEQQGLRVEVLHYWNAWLFFPVLLWRQLSRWCKQDALAATESDLGMLPHWLNTCVSFLTQLDMGVAKAFGLPFGTSVFAVARKPG